MQKEIIENVDELSRKSRRKLNKQIERVQKEVRVLRAQTRQLRQAHLTDTATQVEQHLPVMAGQIVQSSKELGQNVFKRGGELTSSGVALAGSQLKMGQRFVTERSGDLVQDWSQRGSDAAQNLSEWGDEASHQLRKRGKNVARNVDDWREEAAYKLRKRAQTLTDNMEARREQTARRLRKQGRNLNRNLVDRKDEASRKLRNQGKQLTHTLAERRDQVLGHEPEQNVWPMVGFISGLLLAAVGTYWLVQRVGRSKTSVEEERIESPDRRASSRGGATHPGDVRSTGQGGTAVATRPSETTTEEAAAFVGVLSSKQYYPIERKPDADAHNLVFFANENVARDAGFTADRSSK